MSVYDDLKRMLDEMHRKGAPVQKGIAKAGSIGLEAARFTPWGPLLNINTTKPTMVRKDLTQRGNAWRNIADTFKGMQQAASYRDPMVEMFNNLLEQLQQPVGVNEADLMAQIRAQFDPIYNERARLAETRTERGRGEVEAMYGALAKDYERLAPEQAESAEEYQGDIEDLYGQLRSNIEGHYARVGEEQADMMKQLGIEAAAPDVMGPQNESQVEALTAASELEAINSQRALDIGNIDETYYREGAPLANLTGSNISSDMLFDLNRYLEQLEAEKSSGIQQSFNQLFGQAQSQAAQTNQQNTQMLWQILQSQMQGQEQQPMDANSFLSSLPPQVGAEVTQAFTALQRSPEAVFGKVEDPRHPTPGTFVPTTPQWYMQQVDKMAQSGQISESTRQALLMYLQLLGG